MFALASGYIEGESSSEDEYLPSTPKSTPKVPLIEHTLPIDHTMSIDHTLPPVEPNELAPATPAAPTSPAAGPSSQAPSAPASPVSSLSLLESSNLLHLAVTHNRVDIITEILAPLLPHQQHHLLHPSPTTPPYSDYTTPTTTTADSEIISTRPPKPPLTIACAALSIPAAAYLLSKSADPSFSGGGAYPSPWSLACTDPALRNVAFGSEVLKCLQSDDVKRIELFVRAGVKEGDFVEFLGGTEEGVEKGCKEMGAVECAKFLSEAFTAPPTSASKVRTTTNDDKFAQSFCLCALLQISFNEISEQNEVIKSLAQDSSFLLLSIRSLNDQIKLSQEQFQEEMLSLEVLLTEVDDLVYRFLESNQREKAGEVVNFRETVVADQTSGECCWLDINEVLTAEILKSVVAANEERVDEAVGEEIEKVEGRIVELKELIGESATEGEILPEKDHSGLRHWRTIRAEAKEWNERCATVKVHQERCKTEIKRVEKVLIGMVGVSHLHFEEAEEDILLRPLAEVGGGEAISSLLQGGSPSPTGGPLGDGTSLWSILVQLVFGISPLVREERTRLADEPFIM